MMLHQLFSPFKIYFSLDFLPGLQSVFIFQLMHNNRILLENINNFLSIENAEIMQLPAACWVEGGLVEHNKIANKLQDFALEFHISPVIVVEYFCIRNSCQIKFCFLVGCSSLLSLIMPFGNKRIEIVRNNNFFPCKGCGLGNLLWV